MDATELERTLTAAFPDARVRITDLTGTADHYRVEIASEVFRGKSRVQQHKLVYAALGVAVGAQIHALALSTLTPEAWDHPGR